VTVLLIRAVVAVVLVLALVRAFAGPPPARMRPFLALAAGFLGVAAYPVAVLVAASRHPHPASLLLAGSVAALALAAWAARGSGDDGGEGGEPGPDPPIDWEAFDTERERWEHSALR
jgi:hypothetical protein